MFAEPAYGKNNNGYMPRVLSVKAALFSVLPPMTLFKPQDDLRAVHSAPATINSGQGQPVSA